MITPPRLELHTPSALAPDRYLYPAPALLFVHTMPCAVDRSLAVICYDNALRLLTLEGTEAKLVPVANDYLPSIAGGQLSTVEPSPTEHELCYLQSRRLVLFDMVSRTHKAYRVIDDVDMEQIAMAGALASRSPAVVIAQVEDTTHYGKDGHVDARLLSCEIGPQGLVKRGTLELEQDAEKELDWGAGRGLVVAYKHGYLEVYDALLVPQALHPLGPALRQLFAERRALRLQGLRFHPTRDVAVFAFLEMDRQGSRTYCVFQAEFGGGSVTISPIGLAEDVGLLRLGSFSPDGEWTFFQVSEGGQTHFFVHRIFAAEGELPLNLGAFPAPRSAHFARGPLSLIVMDDDLEVVCSFPLPSSPAFSRGD